MKILILIDKPNWAYHSIAKALCKYNRSNLCLLSILPIKKGIEEIERVYKQYDLFYVMGFQTYEKVKFLPKNKTMVGVHSCHSWDNKQTTPDNIVFPDSKVLEYLNSFLRVNVVSKYLYDIFREAGVSNLYCTPNGVDSNIFIPIQNRVDHNFTVGYSGTKSHDWRKGITEFIIPSAKKSNVKINLAMRATGSYIKLEEMPSFYNTIDVYICASLSEGFSLSVLEAAACGVPIISTKITGCTELIRDGINGFFVDRNISDISDKINILKNNKSLREEMSKSMREDIVLYHCWSKKSDQWIKFFMGQ